ncbi:fibropellin-3-like [Ruditapes philippinarum]|uniref:fibropellin-3-like n=1 Tax=Ruditapes philippinarum TaxID=129788 RepID=UPI00295B38D2|nr:fibropellin-3-like [Ruditapes philippinarum]
MIADIDDCINAVCLNGATCEDFVNDYTCHCTPGFTGTHCEIDIDDCINASCLNGATCVDLVNDYTCQCTPGFTGTNCGIDIDDCINAVCLNGANCEDFVNDYTCHCAPGFTGTHCEIDIDDCTSASCLNGATCVDLVNDYTCCCVPGFTGTHCEIDIDDCINAVCLNNGTCEDLVNAHTCQCTPGFTGTVCESVYKDPCLPGWTHDRNSCYLYVSTTFNWLSAVSHCQSLDPNAYLVEITDDAENTLVYTISSLSDVWIGLSDRISEGNFYWENSGDILTYIPYGIMYYTESASKDCVFMHIEHWDAGYCTNYRPIVCEMPEQ